MFAHQVCREDSPTKGLYDHCQCDDLDRHLRSQACLKLDYFFDLQYLGQYLSHHIQTWHDSRPIHFIYAHARFNDHDLDTRS